MIIEGLSSCKKKYQIVYADPPWAYRNKRTGGSMNSGSASKYSTMSIQDIASLPIENIAEKDSVLFLWATTPLLPEALNTMKAWEYTYKTAIYWRKIMSLGMGYWFRGQVEVLLVGIKGKVKAFRIQKPNFLQTKVRKHSQKPDEVYDLVEMIPLSPRIELFARQEREGWDCWGDEVVSHSKE